MLDRQTLVEVSESEAEGAGQGGAVALPRCELRDWLVHPNEAGPALLIENLDRQRADAELQVNWRAAAWDSAKIGQRPGCADDRMPGEGQLSRGSEDAHAAERL